MMLFSHWLLWLKNCRFSTNSCKGFIVPLTQQAACSKWKHKVHTKVFISWNAISFFMASSTIWSYFQWFVKSKTKEFCGWQLIILWKGLSSYSRVYRITCDVALCLSCLIHFKNVIQREVGQLSMTNHSWVIKVFVKSITLFFGQNKYTNIRR